MPQQCLITGATSGIGAAFARAFAARGYNLLLTGRREEKLAEVATGIEKKWGVEVQTMVCELSASRDVNRLLEAVREQPAEVLVNNAGFGLGKAYHAEDEDALMAMLDVHVRVPMKLIHALLPGMISARRGTIINVSSLASFIPVPRSGTYNATKSFLNVFTESLHLEVKQYGITVQALLPGFTRTDFHRNVREKLPGQNGKGLITWMSPDEVVNYSLAQLPRGKVICIPGRTNRMLARLVRVLPRPLVYRLVANR